MVQKILIRSIQLKLNKLKNNIIIIKFPIIIFKLFIFLKNESALTHNLFLPIMINLILIHVQKIQEKLKIIKY